MASNIKCYIPGKKIRHYYRHKVKCFIPKLINQFETDGPSYGCKHLVKKTYFSILSFGLLTYIGWRNHLRSKLHRIESRVRILKWITYNYHFYRYGCLIALWKLYYFHLTSLFLYVFYVLKNLSFVKIYQVQASIAIGLTNSNYRLRYNVAITRRST